ncbi:guanine deaminase [Paracoccidioides brasiliensis Pb18]|uniref:Probable guanine deaminase n=1 Tax=Paracoccidioides brasiliensis (strain Pb18) TaxID=502780 RepID=C1G019_PARBD|nr:guanine deaminase [Paracoccidioides brasiliensis Pb18]EEH43920.2 guanine deaminase [Paracoccidioides brasiliensis Pb18]
MTANMRSYVHTVYYGTFIHLPRLPEEPATPTSPPAHKLSINHGALWVSETGGKIEGFDWGVKDEEGFAELMKRMGWRVEGEERNSDVHGIAGEDGEGELVRVVKASRERNGFFFPGFIDTHIHAPQYPNSGIFGSSTLLDWLETYTFPLESSFGNKEDPSQPPPIAHTVYNRVVSRTLSHGTTCAAYYATIHVPATNLLATICHRKGQRALIGRSCMDSPATCPSYYREESASASLSATKATIAHINSLDPTHTLVRPVITPRFAPSCTPAAMSQFGALAASTSPPTFIQTHIAENLNEIALVARLFPSSKSYADVYDSVGLLTPHTILAHAVHLSPDERALIAKRRSSVAHCPASNSAICSGLCPVRELLDEGITVGLGTDVSGGWSPSVLEAVRQACLVSRLLQFRKQDAHADAKAEPKSVSGREKISVEEGLYLATRGGAGAVGMQDAIGGFEVGMWWDAQMVEIGEAIDGSDGCTDVGKPGKGYLSNVDIFGWESWEEKIAKWVWSGDDRNVKAVWVAGRLVHERA